MRTRIGLLAQPEFMHSRIEATQRKKLRSSAWNWFANRGGVPAASQVSCLAPKADQSGVSASSMTAGRITLGDRCTRWRLANLELTKSTGGLRNGAVITHVVFPTLKVYEGIKTIVVLCGIGASACQSRPQSFIMKTQLSHRVARV